MDVIRTNIFYLLKWGGFTLRDIHDLPIEEFRGYLDKYKEVKEEENRRYREQQAGRGSSGPPPKLTKEKLQERQSMFKNFLNKMRGSE